jgi:hypothetical protein
MTLPTSITTNVNWVAFNAHGWFAYAIVYTCHASAWVVGGTLIAAALKEFWIDHLYESPAQPFHANFLDFVGYATGVGLAVLVSSII